MFPKGSSVMRKKLTFEKCEPRLLLTTTIYLDFGLGLGSDSIDTTVAELRDFLNDNGTILADEQFTGTDMTQPDEFFGSGAPPTDSASH